MYACNEHSINRWFFKVLETLANKELIQRRTYFVKKYDEYQVTHVEVDKEALGRKLAEKKRARLELSKQLEALILLRDFSGELNEKWKARVEEANERVSRLQERYERASSTLIKQTEPEKIKMCACLVEDAQTLLKESEERLKMKTVTAQKINELFLKSNNDVEGCVRQIDELDRDIQWLERARDFRTTEKS